MKIEDNGISCTVTLETPEGQSTFRAATDANDRRVWTRSEETCELSKFVNDNRKHSQISVKIGDSYRRIK